MSLFTSVHLTTLIFKLHSGPERCTERSKTSTAGSRDWAGLEAGAAHLLGAARSSRWARGRGDVHTQQLG